MSRFLLVFFILFFFLEIGHAQLESSKPQFILNSHKSKVMGALYPQGLFMQTLRLDTDIKLMPSYWLQIAIQHNDVNKEVEKAFGGGLIANLRWYPENYQGLFLAWGVEFEYNQVSGTSLKTDLPSEIPYLVHTSRFGTQFQVGYLFQIYSQTTLDVFAGFGNKVASYNFPDPEKKIEMKKVKRSSYNYSGVVFQIGLRVGFIL